MRRVHYTRLGIELALNGAGVSGDNVMAEATVLSCQQGFSWTGTDPRVHTWLELGYWT